MGISKIKSCGPAPRLKKCNTTSRGGGGRGLLPFSFVWFWEPGISPPRTSWRKNVVPTCKSYSVSLSSSSMSWGLLDFSTSLTQGWLSICGMLILFSGVKTSILLIKSLTSSDTVSTGNVKSPWSMSLCKSAYYQLVLIYTFIIVCKYSITSIFELVLKVINHIFFKLFVFRAEHL